MDECIVERGKNVGNTEDKLALANLRAKLDLNLLLRVFLSLSWRHSLI